MTSRQVGGRQTRHRVEDQELRVLRTARTALLEQTKGDHPIHGEATFQAARHNPLAVLSDGTLKFIEVASFLAIVGVGFGYLVPTFTLPPTTPQIAALAGLILACLVACLASARLSENTARIISASRHWKIADTGIFLAEHDFKADKPQIDFIAWGDVAVAESHRGRIVLIRADGQILAGLNNPGDAQEILRDIQIQRSRRGESNPGEVRGPRIEPRFDLPERLEPSSLFAFERDGPIDLDAARHDIRPLDFRREPTAPTPTPTLMIEGEVIAIRETPVTAKVPPALENLDPDVIAVELSQRYVFAIESGDEAEIDWTTLVLADVELDADFGIPALVIPAAPIEDPRIQRAIEEAMKIVFGPIHAEAVPAAIVETHAAVTAPVPVDLTQVTAGNDDPIADAEDQVMKRLISQLVQTAKAKGLDPKQYVFEGIQAFLSEDAAADNSTVVADDLRNAA